MKRIESGQGATDLGSVENDLNMVKAASPQALQPTIAKAVAEIDNMRACVAEVRSYAEGLAGTNEVAIRSRVLRILESHGL